MHRSVLRKAANVATIEAPATPCTHAAWAEHMGHHSGSTAAHGELPDSTTRRRCLR